MVNWDALATQVAKELGPGATVVRGPTGAARFVLEALSQEDTEALGPTCRTQTPGSEDTGPTCKAQARLGSQTTPTRSPHYCAPGPTGRAHLRAGHSSGSAKDTSRPLTDPATDPGCRSRPGRAACIRRCHASASDSHGPRPHRGRRVLSGAGPSTPSDIPEALFGDSARPFSPSTRPKAGFRGAGGQMLRMRRRSASCR